MTLAHRRCSPCDGWITYCVELYGHEGPIELHFLTHHSNQDPAINEVLTTGLMAEKGGRAMAPDVSVPMEVEEAWDRFQAALHDFNRAKGLRPVLVHYSAMAREAAERVSIPTVKLDALLTELAELRAAAPPATTGFSEIGVAS